MMVLIGLVVYFLLGLATVAFAGRVLGWKPHRYLEGDYLFVFFFWWFVWFLFACGALLKILRRVAGDTEYLKDAEREE